jgi:hypothetical protein
VLGARKQFRESSNQCLQVDVRCDPDLCGIALDPDQPVDFELTKLAEQHMKPEAKVPKLRREMEMHQFEDHQERQCSKAAN